MDESRGFRLVLSSKEPSLQPTQFSLQTWERHLMVKNKKDTSFQAWSIPWGSKATPVHMVLPFRKPALGSSLSLHSVSYWKQQKLTPGELGRLDSYLIGLLKDQVS